MRKKKNIKPDLKPTDLLQELSKAKNMTPFRPFLLHLTSGQDLPIGREEQVALNIRDNVIFVFGDDAYHIIKPDEIASIIIPQAATS